MSNNIDCCISQDNKYFRYRAAAIIVENDCILLASNDVSDYYYSVGGGVHIGETSQKAVEREVFEETGVKYEVDRLIAIHENFFSDITVFKSDACHEISLYYLMKPRGTQELNSNSTCLVGKEYMNWIPISDLKNITAYPTFLYDVLENPTKEVKHYITKQN